MEAPLKNLTLVIPFRMDCEERKQNLSTLLRWVATWECAIIVLEADATPKISGIWIQEHAPYARYIFQEDDTMPFHRTHYINHLLSLSSTSIVGVWDSDIIVSKQGVEEACANVLHAPYTIAYPYNGKFIMHSPFVSQSFREHLNWSILERKQQPCMGRPSCGGAFVVHRDHYLAIGGENEHFHGWGPEDSERLRRCQILGWNSLWSTHGAAHHLHHPRSQNTPPQQENNLLAMRQELWHECSLQRTELQRYIQDTYTWATPIFQIEH